MKKIAAITVMVGAAAMLSACSESHEVDMANQKAADASARADQAAKSAQEAAAAAKAAQAAAEAAADRTGRMNSHGMRK